MVARRISPARAGRGHRLPAWLAAAAAGANRLASSRLARTLLTVAILALAAWLIRGQLQGSRLGDIARAVAATPPLALGLCAAFTVAAYLCEGVVEWHALRFIGHKLPVGRTLLAASSLAKA